MDKTMTYGSFAILVGLVALVVTCIYLISLIRNLNASAKILKKLLKENSENINNTLKDMPVISKNLVEASSTASSELKAMENAINSISETTEIISATAHTIRYDIFGKIKGVAGLLDLISRLIFKQKEDKDKHKEKEKEDVSA